MDRRQIVAAPVHLFRECNEEGPLAPRFGPDFDLVRIRLAQARKHQTLSLRAVSDATGISPATLSRFESKKGNPDIETLSRLVDWLELDRSDVFAAPAAVPADTPGVVEVHLRADPKLDPRTAQALAEGFRIMYERFTQDEPERPVPRDARRG
jgi:transcriptional regulator with XRE-family HTH domain